MKKNKNTTALTGKQIQDTFFSIHSIEKNTFICNLCNKSLKTNETGGYTNIKKHIETVHSTAFEKFKDAKSKGKSIDLDEFRYSNKSLRACAWLEIIVMCLLPFSAVYSPFLQKISKYGKTSRPTLMHNLNKLTNLVEKKISLALPEIFSVVFEGWSCGDTHYLALFATYPSKCNLGFEKVLLGFAPLGEEQSLDAESHFEYMEFVLEVFEKSMTNVVAISGDNCAVNLSLAKNIHSRYSSCHYIGCASHRFNLAVQDLMTPYREVIDKVNSLMKKLQNLIPAAKLRRINHLKAKTSIKTRWSSTYAMITRFRQISDFILKIDLTEIICMMPTHAEMKQLDKLYSLLRDLDSVTNHFQSETASLAEIRAILNGVLEQYPETLHRLNDRADIILHSDFESARAKIQDDKEDQLTDEEKLCVTALLKDKTASPIDDISLLPLAQRVLKKRKMMKEKKSEYIDLRFLQGTSNIYEIFFSKAGYAASNRRKSILPVNLESQLFLHVNKSFWRLKEVHEIMSGPNHGQGASDDEDNGSNPSL